MRETGTNNTSIANPFISGDKLHVNGFRRKFLEPLMMYMLYPAAILIFSAGAFHAYHKNIFLISVFDGINLILTITFILNRKAAQQFGDIGNIILIYFTVVSATITLDSFPSGMFYLLILTLFILLRAPNHIVIWSVIAYCVTYSFYVLAFYTKFINTTAIKNYSLLSWLAFSFCLVLLSLLSRPFILKLIARLNKVVIKNRKLNKVLEKESLQNKVLNKQLANSNNQYYKLFFSNELPMWTFDPASLNILEVNNAALTKYGYSKSEFAALTLKDIGINERHDFNEDFNSRSTPYHCNSVHKTKDNQTFYVSVQYNPIIIHGKKVILVISRDISQEMVQLNTLEVQALKLREIAFIQSHIVRAPLARMMGLINLLNIENEEASRQQLLEYLSKSANEFDEIIKVIIDTTEVAGDINEFNDLIV